MALASTTISSYPESASLFPPWPQALGMPPTLWFLQKGARDEAKVLPGPIPKGQEAKGWVQKFAAQKLEGLPGVQAASA